MPRLRDTTCVNRSAASVRMGLERLFASAHGKDGVARLRLRVPQGGSPDGRIVSHRDVRVEARQVRERRNDLLEVSWRPEGTMVFPAFDGTLTLWSEADPSVSYLELDGTYTPPFGAAGQRFDALIGDRIAHATAHKLLNDLRLAIERES